MNLILEMRKRHTHTHMYYVFLKLCLDIIYLSHSLSINVRWIICSIVCSFKRGKSCSKFSLFFKVDLGGQKQVSRNLINYLKIRSRMLFQRSSCPISYDLKCLKATQWKNLCWEWDILILLLAHKRLQIDVGTFFLSSDMNESIISFIKFNLSHIGSARFVIKRANFFKFELEFKLGSFIL